MIRNKILLTALLAAAFSGVQAQDDGFDLSSQRGEKQDVNVVPGKKLEHHGIVINPTQAEEVCRRPWFPQSQ